MTEAEKKAKAETKALVDKAVAAAMKKAEALAIKAVDVAVTAALDEVAVDHAKEIADLVAEVEAAKKVKGSKSKGSGLIKAKAGKYAAKRKCYFGISLYVKGQPYHATEGEMIPHHFKKVKDDPIETDDDYDEDDE